jgi:hypothetical protein
MAALAGGAMVVYPALGYASHTLYICHGAFTPSLVVPTGKYRVQWWADSTLATLVGQQDYEVNVWRGTFIVAPVLAPVMTVTNLEPASTSSDVTVNFSTVVQPYRVTDLPSPYGNTWGAGVPPVPDSIVGDGMLFKVFGGVQREYRCAMGSGLAFLRVTTYPNVAAYLSVQAGTEEIYNGPVPAGPSYVMQIPLPRRALSVNLSGAGTSTVYANLHVQA